MKLEWPERKTMLISAGLILGGVVIITAAPLPGLGMIIGGIVWGRPVARLTPAQIAARNERQAYLDEKYLESAGILPNRVAYGGQPYALVVDVETTGLPPHRSAPTKAEIKADPDSWPRIVQIAWVIVSDEMRVIEFKSEYILQDGPIPYAAKRIHGISDETCEEEGVPLTPVLQYLSRVATECHYLVGHNIKFDQYVIQAECYRLGLPSPFTGIQRFDTMSIAKQYGRSYAKLHELCEMSFGRKAMKVFDARPHDAQDDVWLTASLFVKHH